MLFSYLPVAVTSARNSCYEFMLLISWLGYLQKADNSEIPKHSPQK